MAPILIITRPEPAGSRFAAAVQSQLSIPVKAIFSPGLVIVPCDVTLDQQPKHVVFTSANGVAQADRIGLDRSAKAWCVGPRTAKAAEDAGFDVEIGGTDAKQLTATLIAARPSGRIFHISGKHTRGSLVGDLNAQGLAAEGLVAYEQNALPANAALRRALKGDDPLVIPLFSARSGMLFMDQPRRAPLHIVAISQVVADEMAALGAVTVVAASEPDETAMVDATQAATNALLLRKSAT